VVGVSAGSREVPGRKPVTRDNNNNNDDDDDDDNNNNNNITLQYYTNILKYTFTISL
jgi:hypothetical protein